MSPLGRPALVLYSLLAAATAGIVPCVRKAVYAHKFPIFNGPEAKVSSSFSVK